MFDLTGIGILKTAEIERMLDSTAPEWRTSTEPIEALLIDHGLTGIVAVWNVQHQIFNFENRVFDQDKKTMSIVGPPFGAGDTFFD